MTDIPKIDRSSWPRGPWDNEPDHILFTHAGLRCEVKRHPSLGHLCGYVIVPPGHQHFERHYDELYSITEVHGGLTYAQAEGPDWKLGFDCAHSGDFIPGLRAFDMSPSSVHWIGSGAYRTLEYVTAQTKALAEQLQVSQPAKTLEMLLDELCEETWDFLPIVQQIRRLREARTRDGTERDGA